MSKKPTRQNLHDLEQAWSFLAYAFNSLPDPQLASKLRDRYRANDDLQGVSSWIDGMTDEEVLTALGTDRARLIRHVDSTCINPPYESVYVNQKEDSTLGSLHAFFVANGFAPTGECKEPADYIGMELAFLEECCKRQLASIDEGNDEEAKRLHDIYEEFISNHGAWIADYAVCMRNAAQTEFYKEVADLLLLTFPQPEKRTD